MDIYNLLRLIVLFVHWLLTLTVHSDQRPPSPGTFPPVHRTEDLPKHFTDLRDQGGGIWDILRKIWKQKRWYFFKDHNLQSTGCWEALTPSQPPIAGTSLVCPRVARKSTENMECDPPGRWSRRVSSCSWQCHQLNPEQNSIFNDGHLT